VANEADRLLAGAPEFADAAYKDLVSLLVGEFGGICYVKTIYIGFEIDGQMVAAAYPHPNRLEVALPLPVDHPAIALIDATHLTWRTMPVAFQLKVADQITELVALAREGAERVRSGRHDVNLSNDHFMKSRRTRGSK
jgi:hypothetical protein